MLRTPKEVLGLMFVNYRSLRRFTAEDRQVIETVGSIIAIAILDRRTRAIEERLERIESQLRKASNQEAEPETILQNVFAVLREIVDFDIATYVEYQPGTDENAPSLARARFAIDGSEPFTWPARWIEIDPALVKWMQGDHRLITDVNKFYKTKAGAKGLGKNPVVLQYKKRGAHSVVIVPRIDGGRLLGALNFARRTDKPAFRMDEQDRLDRLGLDRIMRLVSEKLQVRHQQLAASVAGLFDFDSKTPLTEIASKFVSLIGEGFGWEYVAIFRVARVRETFEVVAQYDATGGKLSVNPDHSQSLESGMMGKTRREGVVLRARNVRPPHPEPEGWESPHGYIRTNEAQSSAMCVPVKLGQEVEWILDCESSQIDGFLQPDEDAIVKLVQDIERTIRLWFESRLSNALLNRVDQGVVVVDEHQRIERLNAAARQLLGGKPLVGRVLADFAADDAARQVLASPGGLPASGLRIKLRSNGGREILVLASARVPVDAFNRRIWLFSDLDAKQWIVDLDHMREVVQDVAAQTRGSLLLANTLVRQAGHLVSSDDASQSAKHILERATRSLNKTDITYERLASSLEVIREPQRETKVAPFSMHSALGALIQSLPAEDEAALKLNVPPRLPPIQADSERMAFALRSIVGYLLSIRSPGANVELRAWTEGAGVSLCAAIKNQPVPSSDATSAQPPTTASAEQAAMAAERILMTARKIVESHGGRLFYHVSADGLEVKLEKLPASTASGITS